MNLASDEQLMLDYAQRGDYAAFERLYQRYRQPLFAFIRQKMTEAASNEVFQDVWESLISGADRYQVPTVDESTTEVTKHFRGYLYTIARRRIADYFRKNAISPATEEYDLDSLLSSSDPEQEHQQDIDKRLILSCVSRLPQKQQEAFTLKQSGLAVAEIGKVLDSSFDAIKSRLRVAYQQLRECWEKHHDR
ncbi:sigma-70 family RNA polymerase sigma factor [Alginatibacterium sediminis]|uniref:Sigma-70 family RNA polymerase sigma factor n=1 Tax=Alginatibacterium sediminis TaxID=2164068 RepID=A0A420EDI3_9ALTE|nr:sigma-70 family RNA polymerase sigma factor [Alginatibacterium sediminis]RKF18731.1 sigma-70 family RNA polymerase sigma factor [Alginatibacterium sediminis]